MHMQAGAKPGIMPSTGRAWLSVAILLLIAIFSYLDRLIVSLLVEPIRLSLHATDFQMGLLQGIAFGLFYALFGIPIGWLVDRYSRRGIIYVGMTLWSFAAAMCGMAQTYGHLLIARFGVGVGEASLSPAAYSIISDLFPPRRLALALGVFATGAALGGALAYIVGGAVIQYFENIGTIAFPVVGQLEPWQMVFVVTGLPGIFVAMLVFFVPEPVRRQSPVLAPGADAGVIPFLLANRRYFICHFLAFGLIAVVAYGTAAWEDLARDGWPTVPRLSVDHGVMEPASLSADFTVASLPLAARWLDVGSWPAYGQALGVDPDGNAVGAARAVLHASRDNVVASSDPDHLLLDLP